MKKLKVFVVIEQTVSSLGCEERTQILGIFYSKENAKKAIEKNQKQYQTWAGKYHIEKYTIQ